VAVHNGSQGARRDPLGVRQRFVAASTQLDDGMSVVSVMGDVDLATAPVLERTLLDVTEAGAGGVIVDLTGCSFLDSHGLRALLVTKERLERSNRSLGLVLWNPAVLRVFQITKLEESFAIHPSLVAAGSGA
jgi:anti-sigma B factor antagonist